MCGAIMLSNSIFILVILKRQKEHCYKPVASADIHIDIHRYSYKTQPGPAATNATPRSPAGN